MDGKPHLLDSVSLHQASHLEILIFSYFFLRFPDQQETIRLKPRSRNPLTCWNRSISWTYHSWIHWHMSVLICGILVSFHVHLCTRPFLLRSGDTGFRIYVSPVYYVPWPCLGGFPHIFIYIYIHIHTCIYIHTYIHRYIDTYIHRYIDKYIDT